jgi:hypothetical protein
MLLDRGDPTKVGEEPRKFAEDQGFSFPQGHFYLTADIAHPDEKKRTEIMDDLKRWCDLFRENRCPMKIRLAKLDYARELAMLMING